MLGAPGGAPSLGPPEDKPERLPLVSKLKPVLGKPHRSSIAQRPSGSCVLALLKERLGILEIPAFPALSKAVFGENSQQFSPEAKGIFFPKLSFIAQAGPALQALPSPSPAAIIAAPLGAQ